MSFLSQAQALLSDVEELPSVVDLRSALCDSAVSVWTRHCPTQTALDELLWSLFKQRYGDQDKIASTTVTTSSISGSSESARLASVIDGLFSSVKVGLPVWGPFLSGLIRVSKAPGANPVIRKQCYKFVFEWLRGSLQAHSAALFGPASGRLVTLAVGEVEPLPLCSCHGFPVSDSTVPCFVHGGGDREETLQCEWAPVHFDWVLCLISSGLTDVWSAIRKDVSTRLFGMIDLLPLPYVHRVVGTLVRIAALKDKRETLYVPRLTFSVVIIKSVL